MPRFNLSDQEARALVDYFAAVEKLTNPKAGLPFPYAEVRQRVDLDDSYWRAKTREYIRRLNDTVVTKDGKEVKTEQGEKLTYYQQRLETLQPIWKQIEEDARKQPAYKYAAEQLADARKALEGLEKDLKDAPKDKAEGLKTAKAAKQDEVKRLEENLEQYVDTAEELRSRWEEKEAYLVDGFRLLGGIGSDCLTCHQVGQQMPVPGPGQAVGPPLSLAPQRLRPDWTERWIANPYRMLSYHSAMPPYFERGKTKYQERFVGEPLEQVRALRDTLMTYDRVLDLPVARYLPFTTTGEKK